MCGRLTHVVRRLKKNTYKSKEIYNKAFFSPKEGVILLIMKKVDKSKKAELLLEFSLFYF